MNSTNQYIPKALHTTVTAMLAAGTIMFAAALVIAVVKLGWHRSTVPPFCALLNLILILLLGIYRQYHPSQNPTRDALLMMSPLIWLLWVFFL